ncbi:T9SS type A sorting domain-containing protein [bacterium]|nr:T9SS type A sorting domain-containing protein [bacterium]
MRIAIFLFVLAAFIFSPVVSFAERDSLCMCLVDEWHAPNPYYTYGMAVLGNYLLVPHGPLYILEIGNSGNLNLVSTALDSSTCCDIVVKDTIAYVATNRGLICLDVSNPTSPDSIGCLRGYNFFFLEMVDTLLYVSSFSDLNPLLIVDVSEPTAPEVVGTGDGPYFLGEWDISVDYPYLYAVSGPNAPHSLAALGIFDVGNPDSVVLAYVFEHEGDVDDFFRYLSVVVDDTIIYICGQNPVISVLATNSSRDSVWFIDGWDNCVYPLPLYPYGGDAVICLFDSTKLVASIWHDVWVMDISDPSDVRRIAYYAGDSIYLGGATEVKDSFIFVFGGMLDSAGIYRDNVSVFKYPCGCGDGNSEIDVVPDNFDIDIYPNPAFAEYGHIRMLPRDVDGYAVDITGKVVRKIERGRMNIKNLSPGIYLLKLNLGGKIVTKKLLVM